MSNATAPTDNAVSNNKAPEPAPEPTSPDFGDGRYSSLMREAYRDAQRLTDLPPERCERFARDLGSDWGRAQCKVKATYGKTKSDGTTTLKDVGSAKIVETRSISLARILVKVNELKALTEAATTLEFTKCEVRFSLTY